MKTSNPFPNPFPCSDEALPALSWEGVQNPHGQRAGSPSQPPSKALPDPFFREGVRTRINIERKALPMFSPYGRGAGSAALSSGTGQNSWPVSLIVEVWLVGETGVMGRISSKTGDQAQHGR